LVSHIGQEIAEDRNASETVTGSGSFFTLVRLWIEAGLFTEF